MIGTNPEKTLAVFAAFAVQYFLRRWRPSETGASVSRLIYRTNCPIPTTFDFPKTT
jgi:hypothetical protein